MKALIFMSKDVPYSGDTDLNVFTARGARVTYGAKPGLELYSIDEVFKSDVLPEPGQFGMNLFEVSPEAEDGHILNKTTGEVLPYLDAEKVWFSDPFRLLKLRAIRDNFIFGTDFLTVRHRDQIELGVPTTLTAQQYTELQAYRQALRDFPANVDLDNIVWPTKPAFMQPVNAAIIPPAA